MGYMTLDPTIVSQSLTSMVPARIVEEHDMYLLENSFVRMHIDKHGGLFTYIVYILFSNVPTGITSLFDKQVQREIVTVGQVANRFMIFDDVPFFWGIQVLYCCMSDVS